MKITILGINYTPEPTGNAPYTTSLAQGLVAAGHEVKVVTGYPHYPEWTIKEGYVGWQRHEFINGVSVKRLRHYVPRRPGIAKRLLMEFSFGVRLLFSSWGRPDVVLAVSPALFSCGLAILRIRLSPRRPAVGIWIQDLYSRGVEQTGLGGRALGRIMTRIESKILRSADGVSVIHERFRQYLVDFLAVPAKSTRVIRNWTHLPTTPTSGHDGVRDQLGWSPDDIVVLHAGNMGMKQGLENVIETGRLAQERASNVRFVLMGDGNQRNKLETMAKGIETIQFVEPLPDDEFQRALAAADILLVNELSGVKDMAVPSKLTSYFNSGRPVIAATDCESVTASEIQASGGGIRVDPSDPPALLDAAEKLGVDAALASSIGAHGLRFRHDTLSESAAIDQYDDFITSLATSRGR